MPIGAELLRDGGVHFRVWAPARARVQVIFEGGLPPVDLTAEEGGFFAGEAREAATGTRYRYQLDDEPTLYPDPASRFQPEGPHGPSEVVDPTAFAWTDDHWRGLSRDGQVLYELHVGTFTHEGSYRAAADRFGHLKDLGITCIEVMPVAEFPGRFGWGYDGVDLYAPTRLYGTPDDLRALVDHAHAIGLGVILDVVYNHLGPDGNYLRAFAPQYFTDRYPNEWGEALNFDGPESGPVREFFIENAGYWIREFHFDGLRLDATQAIHDASPEHVVAALGRRAREAAGGRSIVIYAENEPQQTAIVRPLDAGGQGLDGLWNDDLHHSAVVSVTGRNEAYYSDHSGRPQEFISAAKWGYLFQGQRYAWQEQRRGTAGLDLPPAAFVIFLENHDQVANTALGLRLHQLTSPGRYRTLSSLILLLPGTPLLFQGQEFASSRPFLYFADHNRELAPLVKKGRAEFLTQFPSISDPEMLAILRDPADEATFRDCKLDWAERDRHDGILALYRDVIALRRDDRAFARQAWRGLDGAVLGSEAFVLRFFDGEPGARSPVQNDAAHGDRLLLVNLGRHLSLRTVPEPLLAAPGGCHWAVRWSSENPRYGGAGTPPIESEAGQWNIPGHAAVVLAARPGEHKRGRHTRRTA